MFQTKVVQIIRTHKSCSVLFLCKSCLYEIMREKNIAAPKRLQMALYYTAWALRAGKLRLHTHTHNM